MMHDAVSSSNSPGIHESRLCARCKISAIRDETKHVHVVDEDRRLRLFERLLLTRCASKRFYGQVTRVRIVNMKNINVIYQLCSIDVEKSETLADASKRQTK